MFTMTKENTQLMLASAAVLSLLGGLYVLTLAPNALAGSSVKSVVAGSPAPSDNVKPVGAPVKAAPTPKKSPCQIAKENTKKAEDAKKNTSNVVAYDAEPAFATV